MTTQFTPDLKLKEVIVVIKLITMLKYVLDIIL